MKEAIIHFDGGSRGNPGLSAGGAVITSDGFYKERGKTLPHATNNEAEYQGLLEGLQEAIEQDFYRVKILGDSKLVVNQVNGFWECRKSHLQPLRQQAKDMLYIIPKWTLHWIPRHKNADADRVCNHLLDKEMGLQPQKIKPAKIPAKYHADVIADLNERASEISCHDLTSLKVPGRRDEFSSKKLAKLIELVPIKDQQLIQQLWDEKAMLHEDEFPELSDKRKTQIYQWYCRGLNTELAIEKVRADRDLAAGFIEDRYQNRF